VRDLSVWHRVCCVLVFIRHTPMMGTLSHGTSSSPREAGRIIFVRVIPGPLLMRIGRNMADSDCLVSPLRRR
jgi:hypothetical protein